MHISELPTPALVIDLDCLQRNLLRMASAFSQGPTRLRPHFKNHKSVKLAKWQIEAGALGITCATVREAECLVDAGVENILLANEVASPAKFAQVVALAAKSDLIVAVDNVLVVQKLAEFARRAGVVVSVLLDVDIGLHRCGVQPGATAVDTAKAILHSGLRLRGLMGYEGHVLRQAPSPQKLAAANAAMELLLDTKALIEAAGITIDIVSVGGTGTYQTSGRFPGVTELQAGSYLLMESEYAAICPEFEIAVTVLTTVISKVEGERVVLDGGLKSLSCERGLPKVKGYSGLVTERVNAEHAILSIEPGASVPEPGDQVELWVRYGDATVNLHNCMYGVRDAMVEEVFPICK